MPTPNEPPTDATGFMRTPRIDRSFELELELELEFAFDEIEAGKSADDRDRADNSTAPRPPGLPD
jgi:hypothetical protein